ncbi:uncharacterized protein [Hoplias malabaricus]|uniref:uncharacterized protein isoform X2 n=1 Tax=Hoplias malabaricus TaxID=27720 RepID=UPI003461F23F
MFRSAWSQSQLSAKDTETCQSEGQIVFCDSPPLCTVTRRHLLKSAIILHAVLRLQPMLKLREGLQLYDLLSLLRQYPDICQPLFFTGEDVKVKAEFVMASILPHLSDKRTTKHQVELEIINFIQDFLYEVEGAEDPEQNMSFLQHTPSLSILRVHQQSLHDTWMNTLCATGYGGPWPAGFLSSFGTLHVVS